MWHKIIGTKTNLNTFNNGLILYQSIQNKKNDRNSLECEAAKSKLNTGKQSLQHVVSIFLSNLTYNARYKV